MDKRFVINGGRPLSGEIEVRGAKNAATPILAACLLTDEPCVIDNLPLIEDVFCMIEILQSLGVKIEWLGERKIKVQAKDVDAKNIDQKKVCRMRSSILILGSLPARAGDFRVVRPGGCLIGNRPLETHLAVLGELGVKIEREDDFYRVRKIKNHNTKEAIKIILHEFSVTATENAMLAAALRPGKTSLRIAAAEPHVQELAIFLGKMGARLKGAGTHEIEITGVRKLRGASHTLMPDPIEAGTFLIAVAATGGQAKIKNIRADHLDLVLEKLKEMGVRLTVGENSIQVGHSIKLRAAKIQTLPYPGIPTDLQAPLAVLCTQAEGASLIHDPMYEGRFKYINELIKMGAKAKILDPHRATIIGPSALRGKKINSFDLRAGATLIIAALAAKGQSEISGIYQLDRGYEKIEERLAGIGADIKRI